MRAQWASRPTWWCIEAFASLAACPTPSWDIETGAGHMHGAAPNLLLRQSIADMMRLVLGIVVC